MDSAEAVKTLIQCDFDGTITEEDISFLLLDAFADGDWRQLLAEHREGKISVGTFNSKAFIMIKEDKQTLEKFVIEKARLRAGVQEFLAYCQRENFRFAIVSNGLSFYIKKIMESIGAKNVEVYAAFTRFSPDGLETRYLGPKDTKEVGFKEMYISHFLKSGYRVIYMGNGASDVSSARLAHHIFATGPLLAHCKETNLNCTPFTDLNDVVKGLELLP